MDWKELIKDPYMLLITVVLDGLDPLQVDQIIKEIRKQQEEKEEATKEDA
jgi:hypothetical protein